MLAEVRVCVTPTDSIEVKNSLRQGCPGPNSIQHLLQLYIDQLEGAMASSWSECEHCRQLVGDRIAKSRLKEVRRTESQFADDTAAYATTGSAFEQATGEFTHTVEDWEMTVSIDKTKGMVVGSHVEDSDVKKHRQQTDECASNRVGATGNYPCPSFRCKGDLTGQNRFCDSAHVMS